MAPKADGSKATNPRNRDASVLAAAIEVMSEKGYAATSIQEVADKVGVLKGSLYHYFSSKEELLFRILRESHANTEAIQAELAEKNLSPFDELMEFIERQSVWYVEHRERANIFFSERRHLTGERKQLALEAGRAYEKYIQDLVIAAQKDGQIREDLGYQLVTRFLMGALNSVRSWPSRSGKQFSAEEITAASVTLIRSAIQS